MLPTRIDDRLPSEDTSRLARAALQTLGAAVAIGLLAFGSSDAAWANRGAIHDARGDAKRSWDILRLTADNGSRSLRIKMIYSGRLRPHHTSQGLLANVGIDTGTPEPSTYLPDFSIDMLRGSTVTPNRLHFNRGLKRIACRGLRMRVQNQPGVLEFVVPQRCLGARAGRVRITGYTYSPRGAADEADYLERWSAWIQRS